MNFGRRDSQQQLLLSLLATHGIMLFITCKRLALWHYLNLRKMKLTRLQQETGWPVGCMYHSCWFFHWQWRVFDDDKRHAHSTDIATMTSSYLRSVWNRRIEKQKKMITITLIKNWLKTLDLWDMIGYNKNHQKNQRSIWKETALPLLLNHQQGCLLA